MNVSLGIITPLISRPFGFQDALLSAYRPREAPLLNVGLGNDAPDLVLNHRGCMYDTSHNCSMACRDPHMLWADINAMHTMQNCFLYPVIAAQLAKGALDSDSAVLASAFGFDSSNLVDTSAMLQPIKSCIDQYCQYHGCPDQGPCLDRANTEHGSSYYTVCSSQYAIGSPETIHGSPGAHDDIACELVAAENVPVCFNDMYCAGNSYAQQLSPDLAGPGIFLSYLVQAIVALAAFGLQRIIHAWPYHFCFWPLLSWALYSGSSRVCELQESARKYQNSVLRSKYSITFSQALVEFQRAQAFFMIAILAAFTLAIKYSGTAFDAHTYQQVLYNLDFVPTVLDSGCLSMVYVLYVLNLQTRASWYMLFLTALVVMLSLGTLLDAEKAILQPSIVTNSAPSMDKCAFVSPETYCYDWQIPLGKALYSSDVSAQSSDVDKQSIAFCFFGLGVILVSKLALIPERNTPRDIQAKSKSRSKFHGRCHAWFAAPLAAYRDKKRRTIPDWLRIKLVKNSDPSICTKRKTRLGKLLTMVHLHDNGARYDSVCTIAGLCIEGTLLYGLATTIEELLQYLRKCEAMVDARPPVDFTSGWTFGQIIAVTIWVPVAVDLVYSCIWGDSHRFAASDTEAFQDSQ